MRFLSASHRASYEANVIGSSPTWNRVYQMGQQVAPSPATVLLTGESGTGKERMAGLVHRLSPRAKRPVLNAAAMPAILLEAELFRYEKGAFTGALHRNRDTSSWLTGGPCSWTRLAQCPWKCRPSACGCCKTGPCAVRQGHPGAAQTRSDSPGAPPYGGRSRGHRSPLRACLKSLRELCNMGV
jgi:hypothetical protein